MRKQQSLCSVCHLPSNNYERVNIQGSYICFDCKIKLKGRENRKYSDNRINNVNNKK